MIDEIELQFLHFKEQCCMNLHCIYNATKDLYRDDGTTEWENIVKVLNSINDVYEYIYQVHSTYLFYFGDK